LNISGELAKGALIRITDRAKSHNDACHRLRTWNKHRRADIEIGVDCGDKGIGT
jgi:hypothetical protein